MNTDRQICLGLRAPAVAAAPPRSSQAAAASTTFQSSLADVSRLAKCRTLIRAQRHLVDRLGEIVQGPPLLDMLLSLYVAELEQRDLCQSSIESRASRASAHRHSARLVERGMATRDIDPRDHRRKQVKLTREVRSALDSLLDDLSASF
ncbi:MAG: hypothetical protein C0494_10630 [Sphingobium sp.]|nr:hypothetical protein [Sphingobium sp.]